MEIQDRHWVNKDGVILPSLLFMPQGASDCKLRTLLNVIQSTYQIIRGINISFDHFFLAKRVSVETNSWITAWVHDLKEISPIETIEGFKITVGSRSLLRRRRNKPKLVRRDIEKILRTGRAIGFIAQNKKWETDGDRLFFKEGSPHVGHSMMIYGYDKIHYFIQNPWGISYKYKILKEDLVKMGGGYYYYNI